MQQSSAHFEEGIVRSNQSTWQTFEEWQTRMSEAVQETWRALSTSTFSLAPDREWIEGNQSTEVSYNIMRGVYRVGVSSAEVV